jgi:hypothetical protein
MSDAKTPTKSLTLRLIKDEVRKMGTRTGIRTGIVTVPCSQCETDIQTRTSCEKISFGPAH